MITACVDCNILAYRFCLADRMYKRSKKRENRVRWMYIRVGIETQLRAHENEAHPKEGDALAVTSESNQESEPGRVARAGAVCGPVDNRKEIV